MMKPTGTAAILFAAASAWLISGAAHAQSSTAEPHANAPNTARPEVGGQGGGAEDRPDVVAPVLRIISVEVLRSSHGTPLDIIRVRGLASTPGWEEAELIPLTRGTPKDGILELVFVARAPAEAVEATGFEPIEAQQFFGRPPDFAAAMERDYLEPWPAETAQARYLDRIKRLAAA